VLIGVAVALVLVCGGLFVGTYFLVRNVTREFQSMITQDPAAVQQAASEMAAFQLPDSFQPAALVDMRIPFTDRRWMRMVMYREGEEPSDGFLMLSEVADEMGQGMSTDDLRSTIEQSMEEQSQETRLPEGQVRESRTLDLEINGKPASFVIQRMTIDQTGRDAWSASGVFEGKSGPCFLILNLSGERYSVEDVEEILESIE
jgi:hypothetical protein